MLVNEYRLKIQFKKVRKVRNINSILMVGSRPLECRPAERMRRGDFTWSLTGRRERGRGNGNTSSVPIRDAGFAGGKTF
jgi:hypothetical protein